MTAPMLADYFAARKVMPPFADDDPSLLLNIDFRDGQTAVEAALVAAGITSAFGSGGLWDAQRGWNPNGTKTYYRSGWVPTGYASRALAFATQECTIFCEIERAALASCWLDDRNNLIDSTVGPSASAYANGVVTPANHAYGDYVADTKIGGAFTVSHASGSGAVGVQYQASNDSTVVGGSPLNTPIGRCVFGHHDGVAPIGITTRARATIPNALVQAGYDPDFMHVVITIKGRTQSVYIDGLLEYRYERPSDFWSVTAAEDLFSSVVLGGRYSSSGIFRGYIRRFQIANKHSRNDVREGPRIAFGPGDSFWRRGAGFNTPATIDPAGLNAVQNGITNQPKYTNNNAGVNPIIGAHWRPFIHELTRVAAAEGLPFDFYACGESGHGWCATGTLGPLAPFTQGYVDALIAYDPEIACANGTVNDQGVPWDGPAVNYIEDVKAWITQIIQGCYNIREFLFFECFPGYKGASTHATQDQIDELHRQQALQATLHGFTVTNAAGRDVSVTFVPTYAALGGLNHPANFTEGGHEAAPLYDATFLPAATKTMADLHPGQEGMDMMVDIMWPYIRRVIAKPQTR